MRIAFSGRKHVRGRVTCLAGGVGAARFLEGLVKVLPEREISIVVNTGDDIELYGLHISPDLDIVTYTLAGIVNEEKGWGIKNDTFNCLSTLQRYGYETWFNIGDRDFATHIYRTQRLEEGLTLSEVTAEIVKAHGLEETILPMSNDKVETRIVIPDGEVPFQEYMVKQGMQGEVTGVRFEGAEHATPCSEVLNAISEASGIIVCPSNPIVSIGTILTLKGIRKGLTETDAKVVAISPIIAGTAVKGPAEKMMRGLGMEVSAFGVAHLYRDFLDAFILDNADRGQKDRVEALGIEAVVTNTLMKTIDDKKHLAEVALSCLEVQT